MSPYEAWKAYCEDLGWAGCGRANLRLIPINAAMLVFCLLYRYGGAMR